MTRHQTIFTVAVAFAVLAVALVCLSIAAGQSCKATYEQDCPNPVARELRSIR